MGRISSWLGSIFGKQAWNQNEYVDIPLSLLHAPVSHLPVENPRKFADRDLVSERWFKASMLIQSTPNMDAHLKDFNLAGQSMYNIATDIVRASDETISVRKESLNFLKQNLATFVLSKAGYRRDEKETLYNVYSLRNAFCPKADQVDQMLLQLDKMFKEIAKLPPPEPQKKKAAIIHVGMPRPGRHLR